MINRSHQLIFQKSDFVIKIILFYFFNSHKIRFAENTRVGHACEIKNSLSIMSNRKKRTLTKTMAN